MAEIRTLSQAPIREATLDIRFPLAGQERIEDLRDLLPSIDTFEQLHELRPTSASFRVTVDGPPEGHVEHGDVFGYRGTSEDGLWVAQCRLDGLTLSRLAPYQDWEEISQRGRRYTEALLGLLAPPRVDRLALRYVNHFRLPHPAQLADYFVGLPQYPDNLPQFVSNLLTRATLHDPVRDFTAHVTRSLVDDLDSEKFGFILDIDAFQTTEFPSSVETLWETFEKLRVFKNEIFFGLITELNAELHD